MRHDLGSSAGVSWTVEATTPLPEDWNDLAGRQPATVPGEVHHDLLTAGLIPDPFDGDNEAALAWIGRTDWGYEARFTWAPDGEARQDLVADGLDTVATIRLNDRLVGRTANQHRGYRFDVSALLRDGENVLRIEFEGPVTAASRLAAELGDRPRAYGHPFNAVRKMAAGFGWDWGIDAAGVGIWRTIGIESWSGGRLASVRPLALVDGVDGVLEAHVELEWAEPSPSRTGPDPSPTEPVDVQVAIADQVATAVVEPGTSSATVTVRIPDVRRWWPRGYGDPYRYPVTVSAGTSRWSGAVGFRTAELRTAADGQGNEFTLLINGQPVYVKGANWIPADAFLTRLSPERYQRAVTDAADAGMNLLRIWGGGLYEDDAFYDVCDELGFLVWQDFLFACAAYSEDEPLYREVEAEARQAVTRLSTRPSLVLWNGNNENQWGYVEWGWRPALGERSWGDGYYTELLPRIVAELDPRTPYSPGSPYSFVAYAHPNDHRNGSMHIWDVWNFRDYRHYRDYAARFVSEFGFQGPPAFSTLTSVVHDEPLDPYGTQMLVHQKALEGNLKLERGLGDHLPLWREGPHLIDDWHWLTSLNQARAVAYGIEHFRSLYPINRGTVVWQLNDNWPVVSWSAVDYAGIRKPLWYALRRSYAARLLTFQPRGNELVLVLHNDSAEPWSGELAVTRRGTGIGTPVLAEQRLPVQVAARSAHTIALEPALGGPDNPAAELLVAEMEGAEPAYGYFVEDPQLELVGDAFTVEVERTDGGCRVRVEAAAFVKDLALFPDRLAPTAAVDSGLVTLLAGRSHTFHVTGPDLDEAALTTKPVLRCVNDLIAR
jgi:beta-mannosidase